MRNSRKKAGGRRRLLRYYSAGLQTDANNRHLCRARQSYRNIFSDWPPYVFSAIGMTGYVLRNIKNTDIVTFSAMSEAAVMDVSA